MFTLKQLQIILPRILAAVLSIAPLSAARPTPPTGRPASTSKRKTS